jgi:hypothetical protein
MVAGAKGKPSKFVDNFLALFGKQAAQQAAPPIAIVPPPKDQRQVSDEVRQGELQRIDPALAALGVAVLTVAEPILRAEADLPTAGLKARRDAIATAAPGAALTALLLGSPKLMADIGAATLAVQTHVAATAQIAAHRVEAGRVLGLADAMITALATPGALTGELAALRADPTAAADAAGILAAASGWETAAKALLVRATAARDAEAVALAQKKGEQTIKVAEVDAALVALDVARKAITSPIPAGPDAAAVAALDLRRKALADAATVVAIDSELALAPKLLVDIGAAKTAAIDAEKVWQALKIRKETAARNLTDVEAHLKAVPASVGRTAVVAQQKLLITTQKTLNGVKTLPLLDIALGKFETMVTALQASAHGLWADDKSGSADKSLTTLGLWSTEYAKTSATHPLTAEVVRLTAAKASADLEPDAKLRGKAYQDVSKQADKVSIQAKQLSDKKGDVKIWLDAAVNWLNTVPKGSEGTLPAQCAKAKADFAAVSAEPNIKTFATKLTALDVVIRKLYEDCMAAAAPGSADSNLKSLGSWLSDMAKISAANAVKTEYDRLLAKQQAAASLATQARTAALVSVANDAADASNVAADIWKIHKDIGLRLYALEQVPFKALAAAAAPLIAEKASILAAELAAGASTATGPMAGFKAAIEALVVRVTALEAATDAAQAAALNIGTKTGETKKVLDKLDGILADLAAGTDKTNLMAEAAALRNTLAGVPALGSDAEKKTALFALGGKADDLFERAGKVSFTAILAGPDGAKELDQMVKTLGETNSDKDTQALCIAAMEVRFKVKIDIPKGMSVARLPTLYALFAKVPASHVGHDKLTKLEYETDPDSKSSFYSGGKIVLNKIGDGSGDYTMQNQGDPGKKEKVNYFKATTLHEIGHAVDDKKKVMKMENDDFGGWRKETLDSVAAAMVETGFKSFIGTGKGSQADALALAKGLLGKGEAGAKKPGAPTDALGSLLAQWDAIKVSPGWTNCLKVRNPDQSPWEKPVVCTDGYAYHEAYPNDWYRYKHSTRSGGVSDYQWRAPGEWFAELYAYHYMLDKPVPACVSDAITK